LFIDIDVLSEIYEELSREEIEHFIKESNENLQKVQMKKRINYKKYDDVDDFSLVYSNKKTIYVES
jgi:hypothetical protein